MSSFCNRLIVEDSDPGSQSRKILDPFPFKVFNSDPVHAKFLIRIPNKWSLVTEALGRREKSGERIQSENSDSKQFQSKNTVTKSIYGLCLYAEIFERFRKRSLHITLISCVVPYLMWYRVCLIDWVLYMSCILDRPSKHMQYQCWVDCP
jgi:hypothetical protein